MRTPRCACSRHAESRDNAAFKVSPGAGDGEVSRADVADVADVEDGRPQAVDEQVPSLLEPALQAGEIRRGQPQPERDGPPARPAGS